MIAITPYNLSPYGNRNISSSFLNKKYIDFGGSNEYISLSEINLGYEYIESFWMKTNNYTTNASYFGSADTGNYHIYQISSTLYYRVGAVPKSLGTVISDNNWHHYCLIRNTDVLDLYIDGAYILTVSGFSTTPCKFDTIGSSNGVSLVFTGLMDEIACYNSSPAAYIATVPSEVTLLYGGGTPAISGDPTKISGLILYYNFESDSITGLAGDIVDHSNNTNHGTTHNMESGDIKTF